jgi:hypothetical protein
MLRPFVYALATLAASLLVAAGCGTRARDYTPSPQAARASLESALTDWREGRSPGSIASRPSVQVVDTSRKQGQILQSFTVLSETSVGAEGRCYVVRLQFENPPADERARYVVVGIDPVWVFRKEDYDKLAHWEHPMELPEPSPAEDKSPSAIELEATPTSASPTSNERS